MEKIHIDPKKQKVVYNACYGGFGLSREAIDWLEANAREEVREYIKERREYYKANKYSRLKEWESVSYDLMDDYDDSGFGMSRHDADLVKCVEALGDKASGSCAELKVRELSGRIYRIDEYDGYETVHENYHDYIVAD